MVETVLAHYELPKVLSIWPLGNFGGFSGAQLWRVQTAEDWLCVRCWPNFHPSKTQLAWIHQILLTAATDGCDFVPAPLRTRSGETLVQVSQRYWEVTQWMPGESLLCDAFTAQKLAAACRALARFHLAAAKLGTSNDRSPGIQQRYQKAWDLPNEIRSCREAVASMSADSIQGCCRELIEKAIAEYPRVTDELSEPSNAVVPLQACIRDIWYPHVLFTGDRVTGIVDYGAMRIDSVVLDLSRLVDSIRCSDWDPWLVGIDSYCDENPLSHVELETLRPVARATRILSGLQWVRWLAIERRSFEDMGRVEQRLRDLLT